MTESERGTNRGVYAISIAAELTGIEPHTLRSYERAGLLTPARSDGGSRRYSEDDLGRLERINALALDGLNLAGIRRVLELEAENRRLQDEIVALRSAAGRYGKGKSRA